MTYAETILALRQLQVFGLRPGLETTLALAERCGEPHRALRFVHVAGTNGKGSVCAWLEAFHRHAGRRVGLYTSPHLVSFRERIQVNRQLIPEAAVVRWAETVRAAAALGPAHRPPTFFEFVTVMALGYFAEQGCDLVIWETGLGGRLDATNIVTPEVSVITNIELDHQQWLGPDHAAIAAEKAGILKSGRPAITGARPGRGLEVIQAAAQRLGSPLTVVTSERISPAGLVGSGGAGPATGLGSRSGLKWVREEEAWNEASGGMGGSWPPLSLLGSHQRANAAVALATVQTIAEAWPVSVEALRAGLRTASWPGRMQLIRGPGGQQILLDGAHNVAGAEALAQGVAQLWPGVRPTLILGMLADKEWEAMVRRLAVGAGRIWTVPVGSERTLAPDASARLCRSTGVDASAACASLAEALARADQDAHVVIAGSLYLVGEALEQLGALPACAERTLNDWRPDGAAGKS